MVTGSASEVLWKVLGGAYGRLGFDALADDAFRALVLARIVEPISKLAVVGVLEEIGVVAPQHLHRGAAALHSHADFDFVAAIAGTRRAESWRAHHPLRTARH